MSSKLRNSRLARLREQYEELLTQLSQIDYILQGSVTERRIPCGNPRCACTTDIEARHGPYIQWSKKKAGKTVSAYLSSEQAELCRGWIDNHRNLDRIIRKMRALSLRAASIHDIPKL
jgi:hypothetical protein